MNDSNDLWSLVALLSRILPFRAELQKRRVVNVEVGGPIRVTLAELEILGQALLRRLQVVLLHPEEPQQEIRVCHETRENKKRR